MRLTFLGTRGYIEKRSRRHRRHSALLVRHRKGAVLIDCGEDWLSAFGRLHPAAIVLTHAHPDHAGGLKRGAPCPVYATADVWRTLPHADQLPREVLHPRRPRRICGITFEAFPVEHSIRAPAAGLRITAGHTRFFYVPDVVSIPEERQALRGVSLYVGDGATLARPILRTRQGRLIGHTSIREQLRWCGRNRIPRALFTHCGSCIVGGDEHALMAEVARLGRARGVAAAIAYDGMELILGGAEIGDRPRARRTTKRVASTPQLGPPQ